MRDCESLGLNTVLFQVRGTADAFYHSKLEPRAEELWGTDPRFDPLAVAIREAHRRGLALHAWVNVLPLWKGKTPPRDPRHLFYRRPAWRLTDQSGRSQPLGDHYVIVNPCWPDVRRYLAAVLVDIVRRYPVDGLHLDYIRFVTEEALPGADYPFDPQTASLYQRATGRSPRPGDAEWNRWRTEQIDRLVAEISAAVRRNRPDAMLSAAVVADRLTGYEQFFQNGPRWLARGWVDAVFPMIYRTDSRQFERLLRDWRSHSGGRPVIAGIGVYKHSDVATTERQVRLARELADGFALFSYASMFSGGAEAVSQREVRRVLAWRGGGQAGTRGPRPGARGAAPGE